LSGSAPSELTPVNKDEPSLLYCNCTFANVIDPEIKAAVLRKLCDSGRTFEAVADLCEMSARRDPALKRLTGNGPVKVAACFPRAVKGLFVSAGMPLNGAETEVLNMRDRTADEIVERLFATDLKSNLPADKAAKVSSPNTGSPKKIETVVESGEAGIG